MRFSSTDCPTSFAANRTVYVPLSTSVVLAKTKLACPLTSNLFSNFITLPSSIFLTKIFVPLSQATSDPLLPVYSYVTCSVKFFPTSTEVGPVGSDVNLRIWATRKTIKNSTKGSIFSCHQCSNRPFLTFLPTIYTSPYGKVDAILFKCI